MTDQTTLRLAREAIAITADNGGGTFEARTLIPLEPAFGFAVGVGGVVVSPMTADSLAWLASRVAGEYMTTYVGTWLDDEGRCHLDAVEYFAPDRRDAAIARGAECGQQAIFDFGAKEVIYL